MFYGDFDINESLNLTVTGIEYTVSHTGLRYRREPLMVGIGRLI